MTRETDGARAVFATSGLAGYITDVNTPGVHSYSPLSIHYQRGTRSPLVTLQFCKEYGDGSTGRGLDFAMVPPEVLSPRLLAVFNWWVDKYEWAIEELIHAGAPFFIHGRRRYPIASLDRTIYNAHKGHVHLGLKAGVFLTPIPAPTPTPEEQVQPVICVPCPTGGYWTVKTATGAVDAWSDAAGEAPYFWSLPGLKITPAAPIIGLAPLVQDRFVTGYWLYTAQGHIYASGEAPYLRAMAEFPSWWSPGQEVIGLVQTGGQLSPDPITYKQLTHQPSDNDDTIREYAFPLVA